MIRRKEFFGIALLALVCLLFITFCEKDAPPIRNRPIAFQAIEIEEPSQQQGDRVSVEEAVAIQRAKLQRELQDYVLPGGGPIANLTLDSGGQPIRTVIVTTWRSGSTFLGDILNALPGNYYHYEPLLDYGIIQIRGPPHSESALQVLKDLLNCDYTDLHRYLEFGMSHIYLFTHNRRLWSQCELYPDYCWEPDFLNSLCRIFPFQSMKTVRLRLKLAEKLLDDDTLNVKVILLVRDPRGTLQSRKHRDWCPGEPDCDQPTYLCSDMVSDYSAAIRLSKLYPARFRALRYEDLSLEPYRNVQELFDFMGLKVHPQVKEFLDSHTTVNVGGVSSTYRDSKNAPFHWRSDLNLTEVQIIEGSCSEAMKLWGYARINSSSTKDFYPLTAYDIK